MFLYCVFGNFLYEILDILFMCFKMLKNFIFLRYNIEGLCEYMNIKFIYLRKLLL